MPPDQRPAIKPPLQFDLPFTKPCRLAKVFPAPAPSPVTFLMDFPMTTSGWPNFFPKSCNNTGIPPAPRESPSFWRSGWKQQHLVNCLAAYFRAPYSGWQTLDALQAAVQPPALWMAGFICQPQHCLWQIHPPAFFLLYLEYLWSIPTFSTLLFTILPSVSNNRAIFDTEVNSLLYLSAFLLSLTLLVIHSPLVSLISSNCYLYF